MRLPKDLLTGAYTRPRLFLCETDKKRICQLETIEMSGVFRFNSYSELTFTVGRTYTNMTTGETQVNPFYNKIEALRLVYLENFGYFEIQEPEIVSDGIREAKNVTAYSLEYTLAQKYLEEFYVNTGEANSIEVINSNGVKIIPVTLYNEANKKLSLLNLILEKIYGWKIGHVDESLKTLGRTFEISRASVYDFIVQDISEKFNCFAVFDTVENTINLYAESLTSKILGDGSTKVFALSSPYDSVGSVSVNSYKTTRYTYEISEDSLTGKRTGILTFEEAPDDGAVIEIVDGSQEQWSTDVYISFNNLAQEVNVTYNAEDIKTVLTVKGSDDLDIREVNMGLPYLVDLSWYYSVDWMGQDLYDAYTLYLQNCDKGQAEYQDNAEEMLTIDGRIAYETNRLSLQYSIADNVTSLTTGTYYIRGGTADTGYYYTEIKLPDGWNADTTYYMLDGSDVDEDKFSNFYEALKKYYSSQGDKDTSEIETLSNDFKFMETYTISRLASELKNANTLSAKDSIVLKFLDEMWNQLGLTPLETLYYKSYQSIKNANEEAGWDKTDNSNYWNYYPVTVVLKSLDAEMADRRETISVYKNQYTELSKRNAEIANEALIYNNFTYEQLVRLNPFLREDEYTDDNFVETDVDTIETIMKTKKELMECGRIELQKLCSPQLEFSMDMANIYALPEFEPIIDQFQLGNLINVVIRNDYIKRARLLEVNINFDDFSDFTCEFGELTNLRTPSSIHADLLSTALTAGKSVASNASYWNKASDMTTSLSLLIEQGLLDATTVIKAIDGNQGVSIDQYGIHLREIDPDTGEISPKEGWIVNNQFLYSSDNFKTTESVFGEYEIDGQSYWGVLAKAVMAGLVVGSTIEGGTIKIGLQEDGTYAFEVDHKGNVSMLGGAVKFTDEVNSLSVVSNRLDQRINETNATIERTDESIAAEVTRAESVEQSLRSSIKINADAITSKVEYNDFATLVEQNYDHVKIAWNNNSKYIAFEDGALNIYKSSSHSTNTLLMKHDYQGAWYYHNGNTVGKIGTNHWLNDTSYKGLTFDLGCDAEYMCWAHKENASDTDYTVKLIYHSNDSKGKKGLHFECDTYTNGKLYLNDTDKLILYNDNGIGYAGKVNFVDGSNTSYFRVNGTEKLFEILGGSSMKIYNNVSVDCYSHINMHGFNIVDSSITTSSDARLKTNIKDSSVDALGMINQIEMKEFDWIENGEHEDLGIIAQQLQTIMPDLVIEDTLTSKLSINMSKFIPYLIKAIQQLSKDESENVSTYSLKRPASWTDQYDILTKKDFVESLKSYEFIPSSNNNVEVIHQPVILPMDE